MVDESIIRVLKSGKWRASATSLHLTFQVKGVSALAKKLPAKLFVERWYTCTSTPTDHKKARSVVSLAGLVALVYRSASKQIKLLLLAAWCVHRRFLAIGQRYRLEVVILVELHERWIAQLLVDVR